MRGVKIHVPGRLLVGRDEFIFLRLDAGACPVGGGGQFPGLCPFIDNVSFQSDRPVPRPAAIAGRNAAFEGLINPVIQNNVEIVQIIRPWPIVDEFDLVDMREVEVRRQLTEQNGQPGPLRETRGLCGPDLKAVIEIISCVEEFHADVIVVALRRQGVNPEREAVVALRLEIHVPALGLRLDPCSSPKIGRLDLPGACAGMDLRAGRGDNGGVKSPAIFIGPVGGFEILVNGAGHGRGRGQ